MRRSTRKRITKAMTIRWLCPNGHDGGGLACIVCGAPCEPCKITDTDPIDPNAPTLMPVGIASDMKGTLLLPASVTSTDAHPAASGYEIVRELGRGGMGVVYLARQAELNRLVALKMILSGSHAGSEERLRFRSEAISAARLQHPNIVQVYGVGEHEGKPFVSLEYVEGGALDDRLRQGAMTPQEAATLIASLARAMNHAHDHGIIHRDLKPGNVLLAADGTPKITDFGLAKQLSDSAIKTGTGAIMGTPSYMPPEQASGKSGEIGPASDVYALGAILYECLTGKPPFQADTALDTIMKLTMEEVVPPRRLAPKCPRNLETICLKCLEKSPRNRYASARELAEDLDRFLNDEPILARPIGPLGRFSRWCSRQPAFATTVIGLSVFYLNHLALLRFEIEGEGGDYHWFVTGLLLIWLAGAWGFQRLVRRPGWDLAGAFGWATFEVLCFTALLFRGHGPVSILVNGYLVIVAVSALRFLPALVWYVMGLCMVCYVGLAIEAAHARVAAQTVTPHRAFIFVLFLGIMGLVSSLLLRRGRVATGGQP
jgi:serine/threonine-protein kinase